MVLLRKSCQQDRPALSAKSPRSNSTSGGSSGHRAAASTAGIISKKVFDKHLERVLAPRLLELPEDMRGLAQEARLSHDGLGAYNPAKTDAQFPAMVDTLFRQDESEAVARMLQLEEEKKVAKSEEFKNWVQKKNEDKAREAQRIRAQALDRDKAADRKKREAQRAFRYWCRLRRAGKYASTVVLAAAAAADKEEMARGAVVRKVVRPGES